MDENKTYVRTKAKLVANLNKSTEKAQVPFVEKTIMQLLKNLLSIALSTMSSSGIPTEEATIQKILTSSQRIALVGASQKPERPAYYVMQYLLDKGYKVIPINPGLEGKELLGQKVYASLSSVEEPIDMVDIFRNSAAVPPIVDEAIAINAKAIWMQVGVVNEEAAKKAKEAGLDVVMNRCPKIEIPRLGLGPPQSEL